MTEEFARLYPNGRRYLPDPEVARYALQYVFKIRKEEREEQGKRGRDGGYTRKVRGEERNG
jgi:hypothetical protein